MTEPKNPFKVGDLVMYRDERHVRGDSTADDLLKVCSVDEQTVSVDTMFGSGHGGTVYGERICDLPHEHLTTSGVAEHELNPANYNADHDPSLTIQEDPPLPSGAHVVDMSTAEPVLYQVMYFDGTEYTLETPASQRGEGDCITDYTISMLLDNCRLATQGEIDQDRKA